MLLCLKSKAQWRNTILWWTVMQCVTSHNIVCRCIRPQEIVRADNSKSNFSESWFHRSTVASLLWNYLSHDILTYFPVRLKCWGKYCHKFLVRYFNIAHRLKKFIWWISVYMYYFFLNSIRIMLLYVVVTRYSSVLIKFGSINVQVKNLVYFRLHWKVLVSIWPSKKKLFDQSFHYSSQLYLCFRQHP